eukprot:806975-Pelagomonas_calceolata.AAC.2
MKGADQEVCSRSCIVPQKGDQALPQAPDITRLPLLHWGEGAGYGSPPVHAPVLWSTSSAMAHPAILPSPLVPISLNTALHVGIVGVNT